MIGYLGAVRVKKLVEDAKLPEYANKMSDSGADVFSVDRYEIQPGERVIVHTGIALTIPDGFECQVRSKSGLAFNKGLAVLNSPGTVDNGYRGEVGVILINHSNQTQIIEYGDKVAQLVIVPVQQAFFIEDQNMNMDTARGEGGFGSTGK